MMIYEQKSLQFLATYLEGLPKTENKGSLKELVILVSKFSDETIQKLAPRIDAAVKEKSEQKIQALIKDLKVMRAIEGLAQLFKGVVHSSFTAHSKK
jgi:hypothetical protein